MLKIAVVEIDELLLLGLEFRTTAIADSMA